jgi:sulfate adenylyltransferase (ADP) / ATP adenylyltransferase
MNSRIVLEKNTLWKALLRTTEHALHTGAQLPIPTSYTFIGDAGIKFFVRSIASLRSKDEEKQKQQESASAGKPINPFLPHDKRLHVADITDTHIAILNKYNVVPHHLLIITRQFEDQETLLTLPDFEALWVCMTEYNGLGFYNGGEAAGASQRHKHLQIVPLPLAPEGPETPMDPLFSQATFSGIIGTIPAFPFRHVFVQIEEDMVNVVHKAAARTFELYAAMLQYLGMATPDLTTVTLQSVPYCFLATRKWMLLVPRSKEFYDSVSINSLGFAGALLVRDTKQLELLHKEGPMNVLRSVSIPW